MMRKIVVCGAGGFIGSHLVERLKREGNYVIGIDLKHSAFISSTADEFHIGDLRDFTFANNVIPEDCDWIFQLAADMGGAGYVFTGEHDADIMHNSAQINLNIAQIAVQKKIKKLFYSSSACIYPEYNQLDPNNPKCSEETAYPAMPDSEYGWEKLFSERLYLSYRKNYNLDVKIARFHNVYGPEGAWEGGKEKAPAALCRKVLQAKDNDAIEIWGDGKQTRSFLYVDDAIDGMLALMEHPTFYGPVNIGSEEMVSINDFAKMIIAISQKNLSLTHVDGPTGVRGRSSDNHLIERELGWKPKFSLKQGIELTYRWIENKIVSHSTKELEEL